MRVLVVDNHDSFTWNIVEALRVLGASCDVVQSDEVSLSEVLSASADAILLGPGPCSPREAGVSMEVALRSSLPILGVCLGHQVVAEAFGGRTVRAAHPLHGKAEPITHDGLGLFRGLPPTFLVARYHSLAVDEGALPADLSVSARSLEGDVMGLRHRSRRIETVQFHPESWLSEHGARLFSNWLSGANVAACS